LRFETAARFTLSFVKLQVHTHGRSIDRLPVVLLHGGPGLPDYLSPVAELVEDLTVVRRYDQRGVGGSLWGAAHPGTPPAGPQWPAERLGL
jgi:pimeloyl-ACP methyl ester carboxylesterase